MNIKKLVRSISPLKAWVVRRAINRKTKEVQPYAVDLKDVNIRNLKVLLTREDLLKQLPKNSIAAEIGVDTGRFSELILDLTEPAKLHLIDAWSTDRYNSLKEVEVRKTYSSQIASGLISVSKGYSTTVLPLFPDEYFDWVYLDSGHGFSLTAKELEILQTKIKREGIIAGHDYCRFSSMGEVRFGVVEAVNLFCVRHGFEFLYLTMETHRHLSFAIRRIQG